MDFTWARIRSIGGFTTMGGTNGQGRADDTFQVVVQGWIDAPL